MVRRDAAKPNGGSVFAAVMGHAPAGGADRQRSCHHASTCLYYKHVCRSRPLRSMLEASASDQPTAHVAEGDYPVSGAMREIGWRDQSGGVVSRHFDDLDAVLEFDALDDFRQLIFAVQSSPCFCGGVRVEVTSAGFDLIAHCTAQTLGRGRLVTAGSIVLVPPRGTQGFLFDPMPTSVRVRTARQPPMTLRHRPVGNSKAGGPPQTQHYGPP